MQEIKVTRCSECPFLKVYENNYYNDTEYWCSKDGFSFLKYLNDTIHTNCPIKGETITFKIGDDG